MFWFNKTPDYVQEAHDRGEVAGSKNEYDNPYNRVGDAVLGGPYDPVRKEAYDDGYVNGQDNPSSD